MKNWLTDFFYFTSAERNGLLVLLLTTLLIFIAPLFFPIIYSHKPPEVSTFERAAAHFDFEKPKTPRSGGSPTYAKGEWEKDFGDDDFDAGKPRHAEEFAPQKLFAFDPNQVSIEELHTLGLSPKLARRLVNFRNKGGKFYKKEDLAKIYGLSRRQYETLEPFIILEEKPKKIFEEKSFVKWEKKTEEISLDINQSSQEDWQKLKGIGPYFAQKIIAYREKLGGFASLDQVAETYKLPDSVFQKIKPFLQLSPVSKKININRASLEELSFHPYISWKKAKVVVNYRTNHGDYQSAEDLLKTDYFTKEEVSRLAPYLEF